MKFSNLWVIGFQAYLKILRKNTSFMRKGLLFALPAIWTYGFSSLSNYTSLHDVFHWFPSIPNLQITAITGLWQQFWPDWGRGVFYTETSAQLFLRIPFCSKVEGTVDSFSNLLSLQRNVLMSSKREKKKWLSVTQRLLSAEESGGTQQFTWGFFWLHKKKGFLQLTPRWLLK